jgi:hypothetical protein
VIGAENAEKREKLGIFHTRPQFSALSPENPTKWDLLNLKPSQKSICLARTANGRAADARGFFRKSLSILGLSPYKTLRLTS